MKTLCIDIRLFSQSGIGTFLQGVLPGISQNFKTTLLYSSRDKQALASYSHCTLIEMKSPIYSVKEQFEYPLKIPSCDLFWAPHFNVPLSPIRAKKRVTTLHDCYHLAFFSTLSWSQKLYASTLYRAAILLSDQLTVPSQFTLQEIERRLKIGKKTVEIEVIPHTFEIPFHTEPTQDFILCVGNLKPHKNLVRALQAYAQVAPREKLVIVGKKEGLRTVDHSLFELVKTDPFLKAQVTFQENVSKEALQTLYASSKLFLFPSLYEGLGVPPLEAMAAGCPVVASRAASLPEFCRDAVEYVDPYSVASIAAGISRLLTDGGRREELIQKGRENVARFSTRAVVEQFTRVFHACCDRS